MVAHCGGLVTWLPLLPGYPSGHDQDGGMDGSIIQFPIHRPRVRARLCFPFSGAVTVQSVKPTQPRDGEVSLRSHARPAKSPPTVHTALKDRQAPQLPLLVLISTSSR